MIKIITWNVNSIRSRLQNILDYINEIKPDILLLQELKCTEEQFPFEFFENLNYNIYIKAEKTYNGVAILSKFPLYDVKKNLPLYDLEEIDNEARYIEGCFDYNDKQLKVASIYIPNGGPNANDIRNDVKDITTTEKFYHKMLFCDRLAKYMAQSVKDHENAYFCGDFNIVPKLEQDVHSVKKDGSITCTKNERDKFEQFLSVDMLDTYRYLHPKAIEYSWWGYRYFMWEKNLGYRIDMVMSTPKAIKLVDKCEIHAYQTRGKPKPSDHVPVYFEIE